MNVCDLSRTMAIAGTARGGGRSIRSSAARIQAKGQHRDARGRWSRWTEERTPLQPRVDRTLGKGLARTFRWRRMLKASAVATVPTIGNAETIDASYSNASYLSRVPRLTLQAPDVVEAILDGQKPEGVALPALMEPFPVERGSQRPILIRRWTTLRLWCPTGAPANHFRMNFWRSCRVSGDR